MAARIEAALSGLLCAGGLALSSCVYSDPLQTDFYCVDIPEGRSAEASRFVQGVANRLDFKISEAQFPSEMGPPNHVWEVYGRGVSIFVGTAMKDGKHDRFGNVETTFNPNRLGLQVVKTGWWQGITFEEVVTTAGSTAHQLGWAFTKARAVDHSCST